MTFKTSSPEFLTVFIDLYNKPDVKFAKIFKLPEGYQATYTYSIGGVRNTLVHKTLDELISVLLIAENAFKKL